MWLSLLESYDFYVMSTINSYEMVKIIVHMKSLIGNKHNIWLYHNNLELFFVVVVVAVAKFDCTISCRIAHLPSSYY